MKRGIPQLDSLEDLTFKFVSSGSRELPGFQPCLHTRNSILLGRNLCLELLSVHHGVHPMMFAFRKAGLPCPGCAYMRVLDARDRLR